MRVNTSRGRHGRLLLMGLCAGLLSIIGPRPALAGTATSPNGPAPVDINYIYSLIDDTNQSTDLNDGKSWLVRYYSRLSGAAGNTPSSNPHPCLLDATTGKNQLALLGNNGALINLFHGSTAPAQDCWWQMMGAWKKAAAGEPGMTNANVTDHIYHLGEVDSNPYVSNPQSDTARQPGPQNVVMLTIPGAVHPEQTVVIGEHPDGASLSTWGSAFDDGQGAAVLMGVARSMLTYWTTHHLWPARTVQFALFDGEEEGLFGSFFYEANLMPIGAVDANLYVGMFNVDQNGIEYPARHLGTPDKPLQGAWFTNINETPQSNCSFYNTGDGSTCYPRIYSNHADITAFHQETAVDVRKTFDELGQMYQGKPMPLGDYTINAGQYPSDCITQSTTPSDVNCVDTFQDWSADHHYFLNKDDTLGRTDQDPFIRCGIPAWGILGAYDTNPQEPVDHNPLHGLPYAGYDTPVDNVGWLNELASGRSPYFQGYDQSPPNEIDPWDPVNNPNGLIGSEALRRALSFAGDLVLNEATDPQMAGVAPTPTDPIAYFLPDRYTAHVGNTRTFDAIPSPVTPTSWAWNFGDGATATGPVVQHKYTTPGVYTVSLTESAPSGTSTYSASIHVVGARADANTVCGQVNNAAEYQPGDDTQYAPTFTNSVTPPSATPEVPFVPLLALAGAGLVMEVRRRRRR